MARRQGRENAVAECTFVLTEKGKSIHLSAPWHSGHTCCGRPITEPADARDVIYRWPPCQSCQASAMGSDEVIKPGGSR